MNLLGSLKRKGMIGVASKLSHLYWRAKSRLYYAPQFAEFGRGSVIRKPMMIANPGGIHIGRNVFIRDGARLEVVDRPGEPGGILRIGDGVDIEQNVHIVAAGEVVIGEDACVTAGCSIVDAAHPVGEPSQGNRAAVLDGGATAVTIGRRVFIGVGSVVLPGVSIGDNAMIGAGSVVTRDVPANVTAIGAPAQVLRPHAESAEDA